MTGAASAPALIPIAKTLFAFRGLLPDWQVGLPDSDTPPLVVVIAELAKAPEGDA